MQAEHTARSGLFRITVPTLCFARNRGRRSYIIDGLSTVHFHGHELLIAVVTDVEDRSAKETKLVLCSGLFHGLFHVTLPLGFSPLLLSLPSRLDPCQNSPGAPNVLVSPKPNTDASDIREWRRREGSLGYMALQSDQGDAESFGRFSCRVAFHT
jgi:hypothetical protein